MLEIGALEALEVLAGKCAIWRPRAGECGAGGRAGCRGKLGEKIPRHLKRGWHDPLEAGLDLVS